MAKRTTYRYYKPSKISEDLLCIICQDVFTEPMKLPCSHVLCEECMKRWIKSQKSCPLCRKYFKLADIRIAKEMTLKINEIPVVCSFPQCCWVGVLKELEQHESHCVFSPACCKSEVLDLLPKYDKMGEEDIETPVISLVTMLYEKHAEIISRVLLDKSASKKVIEGEMSTHKKINNRMLIRDQLTIDRFLN